MGILGRSRFQEVFFKDQRRLEQLFVTRVDSWSTMICAAACLNLLTNLFGSDPNALLPADALQLCHVSLYPLDSFVLPSLLLGASGTPVRCTVPLVVCTPALLEYMF